MAKTKAAIKEKPMEEVLWKSAEKLRGSMEYPYYKNVVIPLIFLKFVSDKFNLQRQKLIDNNQTKVFVEYPEFYNQDSVFYLKPECRWEYIRDNAKSGNLREILDHAMDAIEEDNDILDGALPHNYYSSVELDDSKLASLIDVINMLNTVKDGEEDIIGRVYEYFIGMFSSKEGKGEFYTPKSIVKIITEMIQPLHGQIFDPCCGTGGMFVQSMKLVEAHSGHRNDVSIIGQEYSPTTLRLAKMNMAIRGISANFGPGSADSLLNDQHKRLRADFVMANPPFNQKDWGFESVEHDPRWVYGIPSNGNANYAWIQHFLYHLNENGVAGFVMANGSLTSKTNGDDIIRKNLVEKPVVDCIISMPDKLFYSVRLPVCLWFCSKSKARRNNRSKKEILFIDCRNMGRLYDKNHRIIDDPDIQHIATTYRKWIDGIGYEDILGFCKSVSIDYVATSDYMLTPGRYVGLAPEEEGPEIYEERMKMLTSELYSLFEESHSLEERIKKNLKALGFEI